MFESRSPAEIRPTRSPDRARRRWAPARLSPVARGRCRDRGDPSGGRPTTPSQPGPAIGAGIRAQTQVNPGVGGWEAMSLGSWVSLDGCGSPPATQLPSHPATQPPSYPTSMRLPRRRKLNRLVVVLVALVDGRPRHVDRVHLVPDLLAPRDRRPSDPDSADWPASCRSWPDTRAPLPSARGRVATARSSSATRRPTAACAAAPALAVRHDERRRAELRPQMHVRPEPVDARIAPETETPRRPRVSAPSAGSTSVLLITMVVLTCVCTGVRSRT